MLEFCVGASDGPRSMIWQAESMGAECVIRARRAVGAEAILRSSGKSEIRVRAASEPEPEVVPLNEPEPQDRTQAMHVFRVIIPVSELRPVEHIEPTEGVFWIQAPPSGHAVVAECYRMPPRSEDPAGVDPSRLPYPLIGRLPLDEGRWMVLFAHILEMAAQHHEMVKRTRANLREMASGVAFDLQPQYRAVGFITGGVPGMIELVPYARP